MQAGQIAGIEPWQRLLSSGACGDKRGIMANGGRCCNLSHAGEELVSRGENLGEAVFSLRTQRGRAEEIRNRSRIDEGLLAWYLQSTEDSETDV
eukprot:137526-Hanusia_phi.AAC.2